MGFFDVVFWQSFASNALATFLGAIIGIPIALWISNYQDRALEKVKKQKIFTLLRSELEHNNSYLSWWNSVEIPQYTHAGMLSAYMKDELWQAFSDGGELEWIKDLDLLNALSEAYYSIQSTRVLADRHFVVGQSEKTEVSVFGHFSMLGALKTTVDYSAKCLDTALQAIDREIGLKPEHEQK